MLITNNKHTINYHAKHPCFQVKAMPLKVLLWGSMNYVFMGCK